ncbi:DeoR/GlpR family DNA-binding transcription regulator [Paramicrobacterium fandaimingii]|uniref:DeoR/GlpR family DNA-binding transcription regulator n=1 Tax=Paramicrobacterium fandaimingii TaxID=2708079 RepID=UPI00141E495B|nr:DeoR/GlpR family DNA-binding transcription regulator [Microbacterium fandaimingii]
MYATERYDVIERMLRDDARVTVVDLASRLDITTETVRRDLDHLESAGVLRRVHGGAVPADTASTSEPSLSVRTQRHSAAKAAIARRASGLIPPDFQGSIFFDAGTTTAAVMQQLIPVLADGNIEVVTHSLAIAYPLSEVPSVGLTLIGGQIRGLTAAAVGSGTMRSVEGLRPDIAFVGVNGLSAAFGLSTPDAEEASVKREIIRSARRTIVVADVEKLGREALVSFATLSQIDVLVTDGKPDASLQTALDEANVEMKIA